MLSGQFMVLRQLLLLVLPAAGFGGWLWLLAGKPALSRRHNWLWLGLAGLAAHALLLQSLVYLGLPLRLTAWPALVVGLGGLVPVFHGWRGQSRLIRKEAVFFALLLAVGFLGQAPALISLGPDRFYGNGHYDQANYTVTAEFLAQEKFATTTDELGYRPWLFRGLEAKEQRITECVLLGAVAVTSGSDCQEAYGAVSIFLVALAGVATAAWLRTMGLPRWAAASAGLAAALSPALTRIHLDGFFSQTVTLFVYPALAGLLGSGGAIRREVKIAAALLLAFLIGSYTEVGIFGVTLTIALVLSTRQPWRQRGADLGLILAGALVLNPGYTSRLVAFLSDQFQRTRNPATLAALFPEGGTWLGWGHLFVDGPGPALVVGLGLIVAALGLWGVWARPAKRRTMFLVLGVALGPLLLLRALPGFSTYAFAKLTIQFVPVWLGAMLTGLVCLRRPVIPAARGLALVPVAVAAIIFVASLPQQWRVIRPTGVLARLSSDGMLQLRRQAEANSGKAYLVATDNPLLAQWLCYFGRHAQVVLDRRNLGDRVVPTETHTFRRWSGAAEQLWWLDPTRSGPVAGYEPPPALTVSGATRPDYLAGASLDFVLTRPTGSSGMRTVWLDFVIVPLAPCRIEMRDEAGRRHQSEVLTAGWRRWELRLPPGESKISFQLQTAAGTAPAAGLALLKSLSVETSPGIPGLDPEPVN